MSVRPSVRLSVCQSAYVPLYLSICLAICLSIYLSTCKLEIEATLSYSLIFEIDIQKCENSSIFELGNIKHEASLRPPQCLNLKTLKLKEFCETFFNNGKLGAELTSSYQCVLRFFHSSCLKYCACHEVRPGHRKCCTCHAKSSKQA